MRNTATQIGKFFVPVVIAVIGMMAMSSVSGAGMITIPNFSFEHTDDVGVPDVPDGLTGLFPTSWSSSGGNVGVYDPQDAQFSGTTGNNANMSGILPDGGQDAIITTYYLPLGGALTGSLTQTLADTVAMHTIYTLTVGVGTRADNTSSGAWTIELLAGANVIASLTGDGTGITPGTFKNKSAVSALTGDGTDPNIGQPLVITILAFNVTGNTTTAQDQFDDVRLTSVPEPASAVLLAGGGLLLLRRRMHERVR